MKRIGLGLLLSCVVAGSIAAQNGSKQVNLKEITDGKFRQVTAIGEMRSLPDGEYYTARRRLSIVALARRWFTTMTCAATM